GARARAGVLRAECADRSPGEPAQIGGGRARRDGGLDRAFAAARRRVQEEAAENGTQPTAPARANRNRRCLVARGARRRGWRGGLWRARLWPGRIRARGHLRLGLWSARLWAWRICPRGRFRLLPVGPLVRLPMFPAVGIVPRCDAQRGRPICLKFTSTPSRAARSIRSAR